MASLNVPLDCGLLELVPILGIHDLLKMAPVWLSVLGDDLLKLSQGVFPVHPAYSRQTPLDSNKVLWHAVVYSLS